MLRKHPEPIYIDNIAIPLAKVFHLLVASFQGLEVESASDNEIHLQDYYATHNNDRFIDWISLPSNSSIKKIIDNFNDGFILTFTGPEGIDADAFIAFKEILYNPLEAHGSLATGDLRNLSYFINNPDQNPYHEKMLAYLNEHASHLHWPAVAWEMYTKTTRLEAKHTHYSHIIMQKAIKAIKAELSTFSKTIPNENSFFNVKGRTQIKAILKTLEPTPGKQLKDHFLALQQTIKKQISILEAPPPPENLIATVALRLKFSPINNIMIEAALALEVIGLIYDPAKNGVEENNFTIAPKA